jgi:hypothetical protein
MTQKRFIKLLRISLLALICSCSRIDSFTVCDRDISISPAYPETVIPFNISPLNFRIHAPEKNFRLRFIAGNDSFEIKTSHKVRIPLRKWKNLLANHRGDSLRIKFFAQSSSGWHKYRDKHFIISSEPIDSYLVYRLIEPGYELWAKMGIYQRCLENFDEKPVLLNTQTDRNCMNCHAFRSNSPDNMLIHLRTTNGGTLFVKNNAVTRVDTKAEGEISAGVYPRWHPAGRYVAFSVNSTHQSFHTANPNVIEVYDKQSDLVLYDTEAERIIADSIIHSSARFETFPEWSPDGSSLYFCSAKTQTMPMLYDSLRYDLLRINFNADEGRFGTVIDTILSSEKLRKSITWPRLAPDGRHLLVCMSDYGTFPIWHHDNDLYLLDLETMNLKPADSINSDQSESYHTWSFNGRWIVFSSRRIDGLYTRPFIAYFDTDGHFHPPILLPQRDPDLYDYLMKSYNVPELIIAPIRITPQRLASVAKGASTTATH